MISIRKWSEKYIINWYKLQSKQDKDNNLPLLVSIPATTTKDRGERDMNYWRRNVFLPRTLKIKFGEEYSRKCWRRNVFYLAHSKIKFGGEYSSVYYSTIRGLNAHSSVYIPYYVYWIHRKSYKMISNKNRIYCDTNLVLCLIFYMF